MPKPTKSASTRASFLPSSTLVIDNGGFSLKAGFAPEVPQSDVATLGRCYQTPNSLARTRDKHTYIASQQDTISQWSEAIFRRPVERGQLVSWEAEKEIWDYTFFDKKTAHASLYVNEPENTTLLLTEAPNTMQSLQRNADEIIMEEWGFGGYARVVGGYGHMKPVKEVLGLTTVFQGHRLMPTMIYNLFSETLIGLQPRISQQDLKSASLSSTAATHIRLSHPCTTVRRFRGPSGALI